MASKTSKNILLVSRKCGFHGGVERFVFDTAVILKKVGFNVSGLFEEAGHDMVKYEIPFDEVYIFGQDSSYEKFNFDFALINKVASSEIIKLTRLRSKVTAVYFHDHDYYCLRKHKYYPVGRINCQNRFSPLLCSLCSGLIEKRNEGLHWIRLKEFQQRIAEIKACNSFVVMSDYMRNNLLCNGYPSEKIIKLYPVKQIERVPERKPDGSLVYAGQLIRGKGIDLLLKAMTKMRNRAKLFILGVGNDEERLKELCAKYRLTNRVEFTGWVRNSTEYLDKASVAVVPSLWQEPFGLVGIEAFSRKVPVVGFDVGGINEWLKHEGNGILVPERNTLKMAAALDCLISNEELAEQFGDSGYRFVKDHFKKSDFISTFERMLGGF